MTLSSPVSAGPTGLMEPPLSPGAPVTAPAQPSRSIEAEMVRMGLMTPDEVAATMREESETGRPFTELAVERGHVSAENMAKIAKPVLPPVQRAPQETRPAPPERRTPLFEQSIPARVETPPPAAVVEPAPVPVVEPAPAPVLEPAPAPVVEAAPAPVVEAAPAPVVEAAPAPVVEAAPAPVVEAAPAPVVEPVSAPVVEAAPAPMVEQELAPVLEPEPIVEAEPVTKVVPILPAETVPAPVADPEPVMPEPTVALVQTAQMTAEVFVRLSNGERIAAGSFDAETGAEQRAHELMNAVDTPGGWPRVDGRYVRPDAIVSIDVELNSA